jgi:hypothetical protein
MKKKKSPDNAGLFTVVLVTESYLEYFSTLLLIGFTVRR